MNERLRRRGLRRGIGQYGWALLVYYLIMNFVVTLVVELALIYEGFTAVIRENDWTAFMTAIEQNMERVVYGNGWGYLVSCALAVVLILVWKGRRFFGTMFEPKQDMTAKSFFALACLFLSGQLVFQLLAMVMELLLNPFGLSVIESMEMATADADTFSMFLYMGLGAPVVEEIVFRGLVMRGLQPYGKRFAIFGSALLFGLFHGNLVQTPYAFGVGLVLGYTAMEYSILWAMILHMLNNLVLGDSLLRLTSGLTQQASELLLWGLILICAVVSVVVLIRSRKSIQAYRKADRMDRQCWKAFFSTAPNIILFVILGLSAVFMLFL